jgi:hypothetical protein
MRNVGLNQVYILLRHSVHLLFPLCLISVTQTKNNSVFPNVNKGLVYHFLL